MKQATTIEISLKSVLLVIATLLLLFVAWKVRGVLIAFFVAYILMSGFAPLVDWLTKNGVSKTLAVVLTYVLAIGFLAVLLFSVIPPLVEQIREFITKLPIYVDWVTNNFNSWWLTNFNSSTVPGVTSENVANILSSKLDTALSNLLTVVKNVFSVFVSFVTIAVFTFYLLLERERIKKNIFRVLPHLPREKVTSLAHKIEDKLGAWIRGEAILMLAVGLATYVGLTILQVDFALPLAVIAGLLEIIPMFGPTVAAIPAVIIAFVQSPILAIAVVALYILVQQLENNFLVPKIMEKAVGLSPLVTIFALGVGGTIFGVVGAAMAVPAAAIIQVVFEDYLEDHQ